jgi:hypothetical protein
MRSNVPYSDFLASTVQYKSEANASGKLDTRSESRKELLMCLRLECLSAVVICLFCTYLIPIEAVTAVEGQTEECRVRCVQLDQI